MASSIPQIVRNFYTFQNDVPLKDTSSGSVFGRSITRYEVRRRRDVLNLDSTLGYAVMMTQRVIIPPASEYQPGPTSVQSYKNYPAILVNELDIQANNGADIVLQQMFPKTLNSSVNTSISSDSSKSTGSSVQNTTGSNDSNVNTFGIGISAGIFGELPVVNISTNYSHSWEHGHMNSHTAASNQSAALSQADGASMSVKDWSSYGYLDNKAQAPSWIWGQSYPWDVVQYNQTSTGTDIDLPEFVSERLLSGSLVLPPSQLSLFGLDFLMTAGWIINFPKGVSEDEEVTISHTTTSYTASHEAVGGKVSATLQTASNANSAKYTSGPINLSRFGLEPVTSADAGNGAAIGFMANEFAYPPTKASDNFKIVSPSGNMQVTGTGFDGVMSTTFKSPTSFEVTFKIADTTADYALLFMHWIGENSGPVELHWTVNGKWKGVTLVSDTEGSGGQNNVSSIELRNTQFTSINFHDYLKLGTNTVEVTIAPQTAAATDSYTLFAVALGQT